MKEKKSFPVFMALLSFFLFYAGTMGKVKTKLNLSMAPKSLGLALMLEPPLALVREALALWYNEPPGFIVKY